MEEILNINNVEYIKRDTVKDMENELKELKKIMGQINQLSGFDVPIDTTTRHHKRTNHKDNKVYEVPPSGREYWEIRFMDENGRFFSKNNRKLKVTIKEVIIATNTLSATTTVKEARELRKQLKLNEYTFNRLVFNIHKATFDKFIRQWNRMTQPKVGNSNMPTQNNPEKRKEMGYS